MQMHEISNQHCPYPKPPANVKTNRDVFRDIYKELPHTVDLAVQ
jgi:hypothetical protein